MAELALGFTGTQMGMTAYQAQAFIELLHRLMPSSFHHGDCIGADAQAHALVRLHAPNCVIVLHPPLNSSKRAWCKGDLCADLLPYLERNHVIVQSTPQLVAAPGSRQEKIRSGTWATVRYARRHAKTIHMLWPEQGDL